MVEIPKETYEKLIAHFEKYDDGWKLTKLGEISKVSRSK
jgi:hypothetical protein